jgi:CheY-like chemotaxis protein
MKRILVIEDEAPIRANLIRFLRLEGFETFEAPDGEAGLAMAIEIEPDLIFCDVMMPRMDGFALLDAMRLDARVRDIPFYFLSASAEPERLELAMEKGALGYLTKPFNLTQLHEILRRQFPLDDRTGATQ